jgi:hypothetical protein
MDDMQFSRELATIKTMIERTRRETFVSGYLFIIPGILWIIAILIMGLLELTNLNNFEKPVGLATAAVLILSSLFLGFREGRSERVKSYATRLFVQIWSACGITAILSGILLPLLNVHPSFGPFFIIGIGFYMTGAIYELPLVQWCGCFWWIGACLFAFIPGPYRLVLWIALILLGYVLPGILLNRQYRKKGAELGS